MTAAALADALVEQGLEPEAHAAKTALFQLVLDAFQEGPPAQAWWVPGRLEVFGKHTDYAGGRTLVGAVPRGLAVAARPRDDGVIRAADARRGEQVVLQPGDRSAFTGWRNYVAVVARRLGANFPGALPGADIVFAGDLPKASGMSSSSALVVAVASALIRLGGIENRAEWRENISGTLDVAGYLACVENGMTFGALAGDAGVGTHGGSEDHAAILAGSPGQLSAFAFVPMRPIGRVRVPADWRFVLAPSAVRSSKTGSALEPYNSLALGARRLLEVWNRSQPPAVSLGEALAADAARLRRLVRESRFDDWPAAQLERRLDHFIREDARIADALDAFGAADAARLGVLAAASQDDAERLLGNQVPETSALARAAIAAGAFAASSFGAGFGGSVWALVDRDAAAFAARWHENAFVARPGPPLTALPFRP